MTRFRMLATVLLAVGALVAAPAAAHAYVPSEDVTVTGIPAAGSTVEVAFADGAFDSEELVSFAVSGGHRATLAVAMHHETVAFTKSADDDGAVSVDVTFPADAEGAFTLTGTGRTSALVGTAILTIAAADPGDALAISGDVLAFSGGTGPMLLIWVITGLVLLKIALVVVMTTVRRQRIASAQAPSDLS